LGGKLVSFNDVSYAWGSTPEMVADVRGWLDDAQSSFRWALIGDETSRFASREHAALSDRPALRVHYTKP